MLSPQLNSYFEVLSNQRSSINLFGALLCNVRFSSDHNDLLDRKPRDDWWISMKLNVYRAFHWVFRWVSIQTVLCYHMTYEKSWLTMTVWRDHWRSGASQVQVHHATVKLRQTWFINTLKEVYTVSSRWWTTQIKQLIWWTVPTETIQQGRNCHISVSRITAVYQLMMHCGGSQRLLSHSLTRMQSKACSHSESGRDYKYCCL